MKRTTKTKSGKAVENLTFCHKQNVFIGTYETRQGVSKAGMWTPTGIYIQRSNSHLNITLQK